MRVQRSLLPGFDGIDDFIGDRTDGGRGYRDAVYFIDMLPAVDIAKTSNLHREDL